MPIVITPLHLVEVRFDARLMDPVGIQESAAPTARAGFAAFFLKPLPLLLQLNNLRMFLRAPVLLLQEMR